MKKWWILPIIAVVGVAAIGVRKNADREPLSVRTTVLQTQRVEQTVSCNGVIEAGEITGVFAPQTCIVHEVLVSVGQRVKAGDALITIDKEATKMLQVSNDRLTEALPLTTMGTAITSPTDGIVLSVEAMDGMMVEMTEPCVTVAPISQLQVRVLIREKQLPSLEVGQAVRVSGAGFDKSVYQGSLTEIAGAASTSSGSEGIVEGVVRLDESEADESMRIGLSAKAKVVVSAVEDGLLIPYEAVVNGDGDESYVYFVQDGRTQRQAIDSLGEHTGGVLVDRTEWVGKSLILEPDKVSGDGVQVRAVQEDAR